MFNNIEKINSPKQTMVIETREEMAILPNIPVETFQKVSLSGNLLLALAGLAAGIYYFFKRLSVENQRDKTSRVREHSKILLSLVDDYDKCIISSINNQIIKTMGKTRRDEICRIFMAIQHFLESNQALMGLSEREVQDIMEIHSVIDKSKLSRGKHAQGPQDGIRSDYTKALKKAREICWKKML